jgi:hypothetical protein
MPRFTLAQADLFAPAVAASEPPSSGRPPLDQLADLLAQLRSPVRLPWPDLTMAMAEEQRYLALARAAGAEGKKLAAAIMDETERLFAVAEQEAANTSAPAGLSHD